MSELVQTTFDYSALTETEADVAKRSADIIKLRLRRTAEDIVEIGRELARVKDALPHGKFERWIASEFEMTDQTARRFMQAFAKFGKSNKMLLFKPSVIYELSAPSTPDIVTGKQIGRASCRERVYVLV